MLWTLLGKMREHRRATFVLFEIEGLSGDGDRPGSGHPDQHRLDAALSRAEGVLRARREVPATREAGIGAERDRMSGRESDPNAAAAAIGRGHGARGRRVGRRPFAGCGALPSGGGAQAADTAAARARAPTPGIAHAAARGRGRRPGRRRRVRARGARPVAGVDGAGSRADCPDRRAGSAGAPLFRRGSRRPGPRRRRRVDPPPPAIEPAPVAAAPAPEPASEPVGLSPASRRARRVPRSVSPARSGACRRQWRTAARSSRRCARSGASGIRCGRGPSCRATSTSSDGNARRGGAGALNRGGGRARRCRRRWSGGALPAALSGGAVPAAGPADPGRGRPAALTRRTPTP